MALPSASKMLLAAIVWLCEVGLAGFFGVCRFGLSRYRAATMVVRAVFLVSSDGQESRGGEGRRRMRQVG